MVYDPRLTSIITSQSKEGGGLTFILITVYRLTVWENGQFVLEVRG